MDPIIEKLTTARVGLLLKAPFFGNMATRMKLIDASTSSNNVSTRLNNIANAVFQTYIDRISELRSQLTLVESISTELVDMLSLAQYVDAAGNVQWAELQRIVHAPHPIIYSRYHLLAHHPLVSDREADAAHTRPQLWGYSSPRLYLCEIL